MGPSEVSRHLQHLGVPWARRDRRERAGRRLAPLLEHPHPQGRVDLREGGPRAGRLGALAGHLRGPGASLRASRGDARSRAVPLEEAPYDHTPKTTALRDAAHELGLEWYLPKLAVTFAPDGGSHCPANRSSGSTRTSTDVPVRRAVFAASATSGAISASTRSTSITCPSPSFATVSTSGRAVRRRRSRPGRAVDTRSATSITQAVEGEERQAPLPELTVTADRLVLSAGVFGSTYLLLKNRANFPGLSDRLGTRFCGNGDLLTFAMQAHETVDGQRRGRLIEPGYGPVITSTIRVKDQLEGGSGRAFYIQDGGYPETINWLIDLSDQPAGIVRVFRLLWRLIKLWLRLGARATSAPTSRATSAGGHCRRRRCRSSPWAGTSRTATCGSRARVCSTSTGTSVARIRRSRTCGGRAVRSRGSSTHGSRTTCPGIWDVWSPCIRSAAARWVGTSRKAWWTLRRGLRLPGLIADGSVMPGPVGPNPSNTIAALAHRFSERLIEEA